MLKGGEGLEVVINKESGWMSFEVEHTAMHRGSVHGTKECSVKSRFGREWGGWDDLFLCIFLVKVVCSGGGRFPLVLLPLSFYLSKFFIQTIEKTLSPLSCASSASTSPPDKPPPTQIS